MKLVSTPLPWLFAGDNFTSVGKVTGKGKHGNYPVADLVTPFQI